MMNKETVMKVGDIVKVYEFNGIDTCYMVGQVVGIQYDGLFRAKFIKQVFDGKVDKKAKIDYFTAPLQGNAFMDNDASPRVVVIA